METKNIEAVLTTVTIDTEVDAGKIETVIGESAKMEVQKAVNYIKSGKAEIDAAVDARLAEIDAEGQEYVDLAKDWAIKTDGTVDGVDYSSKYYAQSILPIASDITTVAGISSEVSAVGGAINEVTSVANDLTNIDNVANDLTNIDTVAGISSDISTTAGIASDISAVAANETNINAVNANKTNINAVAGNATNINSVASNSTNINAVAGNSSNINTVAGISSDVTTVANNTANINSVVSDLTNINNVADDLTNIDNVANDLTNINNVAGDLSNIDSVVSNSANINTVAGNISDVSTVAGISSDVSTVVGMASDITTVNNNATNINTVSSNISNVNAVAGDLTNINAVAGDLTNIDNASSYAAQAKQWAIGDPTEPTGNSSKYWADQASSTLSGKVSKTGDSMTGALETTAAIYLESIATSVSSSASKLVFGTPSNPYNYISANKNGAFGIYNSNDKGITCYPDTTFYSNNNQDLGRSNNKWKDLYVSGSLYTTNNNITFDNLISGANAGSTALQSGANISVLVNDSGYITSTQLDGKQNNLTSDNAGTNISITAKILPNEYQLLEYLGANDTISLGFPTTNNSKIECSWTKGANNTEFVYQSDSGSSLTTNTTAYSSAAGNWRFGNRTASINTSALTDYLTVQDNTGVSVNGVLTAYSTVNTFTSSTNLKLFQSSSQKETILIKYLKHYTSGVLDFHIFPCKRIADDTYGFYDVVGGNFYTKEGANWEVGQAVTDKTIISFVNNSGFITGITSGDVTTALGYTPADDSGVVKTSGDQDIAGTKKFSNTIRVGDTTYGSYGRDNIELRPLTTATHGGYIDFHFGGSTADWTSRIIEGASGDISYLGTGWNVATNSTSTQILATKGWVNDASKSTNVVHRNSDETITGTKTVENKNIVIKDTLADESASSIAQTNEKGLLINDNNGVRIGTFYGGQVSDGTIRTYMCSSRKINGSLVYKYAEIRQTNDGKGQFSVASCDTALAPTPASGDNSNKIATTAFVNQAADGQWVSSSHDMIGSNTTLTGGQSYEYSLATYLPNDSYDYEVLFTVNGQTGNTSGNAIELGVGSSYVNESTYRVTANTTRASSNVIAAGCGVMPIGSDRKIKLRQIQSTNCTISKFRCFAYRRIGTNS